MLYFYRAMKVVGMQRIEKMIDNDLMQIETGPNESTTTVDLSISMDRSEKSGKVKKYYFWNRYLLFHLIMSHSKCSNWRGISKLLSNFQRLFIFAIWMGQVQSKLIYIFVTYRLASL